VWNQFQVLGRLEWIDPTKQLNKRRNLRVRIIVIKTHGFPTGFRLDAQIRHQGYMGHTGWARLVAQSINLFDVSRLFNERLLFTRPFIFVGTRGLRAPFLCPWFLTRRRPPALVPIVKPRQATCVLGTRAHTSIVQASYRFTTAACSACPWKTACVNGVTSDGATARQGPCFPSIGTRFQPNRRTWTDVLSIRPTHITHTMTSRWAGLVAQ